MSEDIKGRTAVSRKVRGDVWKLSVAVTTQISILGKEESQLVALSGYRLSFL